MGRELAVESTVARATFAEADEVLGFALSRLMWEGPEPELTATHNAQPAILVHSLAVYRLLADRLGDIDFAAGHSLGEFSAYVAAGALSFEEGVRAVRQRGILMQRAGEERSGTMAAVLGLDDEAVQRVCREASGDAGECVPANYNAPAQVVISGDRSAVERALELARAAGARRTLQLNVSGAFHSPLMRSAEAGLKAHLEGVELASPRFPVVSNVTAQPVNDMAEARRLLVAQLTSPVRWTESMRTLRATGVGRFYELGPGAVLTGLLKRIDREAEGRSLGTVAETAEFHP